MTNKCESGIISSTHCLSGAHYRRNQHDNNTYRSDEITALYSPLSQENCLDGDRNSIVNQKKILLKYAQDNHFPYPTFLIDDGVSGVTFDREGFNQMIAAIEAGKGNEKAAT